jgi:hypothetical protein
MKKVLNFIKSIFTTVKNWIILNGVEGVLGLLVGIGLWVTGYPIYAGFAFGVFASKNWHLLKAKFKK